MLAGALIGIPAAGGLALFYLAKQHASKIEPYIRDQAVAYLRDRFHAEVEITDLRIEIPTLSPVKMYLTKGRGVMASVTARGVLLRKNVHLLLRMAWRSFCHRKGRRLNVKKVAGEAHRPMYTLAKS